MQGHQYNLKQDEQVLNLNNYKLQSKIGSGQFGKVYIIKDKKTDQILAAKISKEQLNEHHKESITKLSREVNIISKLNHPSVLKFIGYSPIDFKKQFKPVIVTEFVSGGTLEDLLNNERTSKTNVNLTDTRKMIIIYGIASAMLYLHLNDIIHRDLKPANILLDKFFHPKVADFGLSKVDFQRDKSISKLIGTPKYMSPEIWYEYKYSKSCDTYAFGIIMFEILTLEVPYESIDYCQLQIKVCQGYRPEFNSFSNKSFQNLIEKCWCQDPTNRPTFQQIVYQLKNDEGFILESADKKEFLNYVKFIDDSKIYYDSFNTSINVDNVIDDNLNKISRLVYQSSTLMTSCFQYKDLLSLEDEIFNIIKGAEKDTKKKFLIGVSLIEGRKNYPQNSEAGILYLKSSILDGYTDAIIYYFNMLIKGSIIPKNFKKAKKFINNHTKQNDEIYLLLNGKIMKKENKYEEALNFFQKSSELGNREALYEYGKMLLKGKGLKANKEEAIKFFKMAIQKDSPQAMLQYGILLNNEESLYYIKKAAD